jgi:hypothetical protein
MKALTFDGRSEGDGAISDGYHSDGDLPKKRLKQSSKVETPEERFE